MFDKIVGLRIANLPLYGELSVCKLLYYLICFVVIEMTSFTPSPWISSISDHRTVC